MPRFFSGKGWQLTCVQHTRRLTRVQHMKYYSHASYNRAAQEDGSRAVHKIKLLCSTRKITLVSHASSVQVTQQKYKNTCMLPHASVNLEISCTVTLYICVINSFFPLCNKMFLQMNELATLLSINCHVHYYNIGDF